MQVSESAPDVLHLTALVDPSDRHKCQSLLQDGWWLDEQHNNWQPSGCMMHRYAKEDTTTCLLNSHVLVIGDSIARQQFFSLVKRVDPEADTTGEKHSDRNFDYPELGISFEFWWDPYLNGTRLTEFLKGTSNLKPSMVILGSGLWYIRYPQSGGYDSWEEMINKIAPIIGGDTGAKLATSLFLSPVEVPVYDKLSDERREMLDPSVIEAMNAYLAQVADRFAISVPMAWNSMGSEAHTETEDGLHFSDHLTDMKSNVLLNFRCNDGLPKTFPMSNTCCFRYPMAAWYQNLFFAFFLILVPFALYLQSKGKCFWDAGGHDPWTHPFRRLVATSAHLPSGMLANLFPPAKALNAFFIFGLGIVYMYFGDRTSLFAKGQKQFSYFDFAILMAFTTAIGAVSVKNHKKEGDAGFLNRDQTDEWKGWMQIIILFYHFTGASSISGIYNPVRILVAAYLFQTGYGHFFYFYKKRDFGFGRILNVIVRLNMLTFVLQYVMNTDYLSYYFTPLVSFWFFVIWTTMWVGNAYNKYTSFILGKILVASLVTYAVIHGPGVLESIFDALEYLFAIHWNAGEWRFRLALDAWIVYVGMLSAFAYIKFTEWRIADHPHWWLIKRTAILASILTMIWYFWFELGHDKYTYNAYHPFISWLPVVAFCILRNATKTLRNHSSSLYCFIGKISLETFIGQFHMWLAADTKGLLVVLTPPSYTKGLGWWFNLVLSSALFLYVCYHVSQATGDITKWICAKPDKPKSNDYQLPLLTNGDANGTEPLDEEAGVVKHTPSLLDRFMADQRTKAIVFLLTVGGLNRLC